jgi:hypothetical protein
MFFVTFVLLVLESDACGAAMPADNLALHPSPAWVPTGVGMSGGLGRWSGRVRRSGAACSSPRPGEGKCRRRARRKPRDPGLDPGRGDLSLRQIRRRRSPLRRMSLRWRFARLRLLPSLARGGARCGPLRMIVTSRNYCRRARRGPVFDIVNRTMNACRRAARAPLSTAACGLRWGGWYEGALHKEWAPGAGPGER